MSFEVEEGDGWEMASFIIPKIIMRSLLGFISVAQLATGLHSSGNAEFR